MSRRLLACRMSLLLALATVVACGAEREAETGGAQGRAPFRSLAGAYVPPSERRIEDGRAVLDIRVELPATVWSQTDDGRWSTPHPEAGLPPLPGTELTLELAGVETEFESRVRSVTNLEGLDAATATDLVLPEGAARPTAAAVRMRVSAGQRVGADWRVAFGHRIADGFPIVSGEVVRLVPGESGRGVLSFEAAFSTHSGSRDAPARLIVRAGEHPVEEVALTAIAQRFEFELRDASSSLTFELTGPPGVAAVHLPGFVGAPTDNASPDLVLIVADTFRADLLNAQLDGEPLLPGLAGWAANARRHERVWSPAPWTLPATASLLFGRYPYEHVAVDYDRKPREDLRSLADHLGRAGYRTAAVTEGVFVSRRYGMDRGFESFEEVQAGDLAQTLRLARERLAADDGRPLFLLVHTYRTHAPYHVSQEVLEQRGEELGAVREWDGLIEVLTERVSKHLELAPGQARAGNEWDVLLEFIDNDDWLDTVEDLVQPGAPDDSPRGVLETLQGLYRATAVELDGELAPFLTELQAREHEPVIAFTSDHGEAFGEHDRVFHGLGLWDELLRVPLVISGPGVPPGIDPGAASLVDVAPTLCGWLNVSMDADWSGRDLSGETKPTPLYAFDTERQFPPRIAVVDYPHKVGVLADPSAIESGERLFAFDLGADPGERADLASDPQKALVDLVPVLQMLGAGEASGPRVEVDEEQRRLLEALGYR